VSEPRQASRPRSGSGPRTPAAARSAAGTSGHAGRRARPARASHQPATAVAVAPDHESDGSAEARSHRPFDELSTWQLLLHQLNALLRDPTLTRALAASFARFAAGVRGLSGATRDAARRLMQAVRRLRLPLPRRVLLALLALALPLALLAQLNSSDDERAARTASGQPARSSPGGNGGSALPGVGMPDVGPAPAKVPPVRVALVLDRTYDAATLRRELRGLGGWLAVNHAAATRVSVIDAQSARASRPARAADLAAVRPRRQRPSTGAAIRAAFGRQHGRRLLVTLGAAPSSTASTLRIATRRGAGAGAGAGARSSALERGRRSRVTIDERRPNALAASIARAVMAVSGQREQR
jgi:hypothetical protein